MDPRDNGLRDAIRASAASIAFGTIVGIGALVAAIMTGSVALIGFALNTVVDVIASLLLVHRFRVERQGHHAGDLERRALRVISAFLVLAGIYVGLQASAALLSGAHPHRAVAAVVIAATSAGVLPGLAIWKRRIAREVGSRALAADGFLSAIGATLAAITLGGVVLDQLWSIGAADAVAALVIALVLVVEGVRGLLSPDSDDTRDDAG